MIRRLTIKNYALIDQLELEFGEGLSIITGETGAGKSIMLGALGLLLGERADTKAIADKGRKTIVEGVFELKTPIQTIDPDDSPANELIIRREISPTGRSRAFVDDSPVSLAMLGDCSSRLLDIHSQHANLALTGKDGQLRIIDAMADNTELLEDYRVIFKNYVAIRNRLRRLKEEKAHNDERRSLLQEKADRLRQLNVKKGEQEEVEREFDLLNDADEVRNRINTVLYLLTENDDSVLSLVNDSIEQLRAVSSLMESPDTAEDDTMVGRLEGVGIELKDIVDTLERHADRLDSNPARLAKLTERMHLLMEASKSFHVENVDDLIPLKEKIESELAMIQGGNDEIRALEQDGRALGKQLKERADQLSERRASAANAFAKALVERCRPLGLSNLRFDVKIEKTKLTPDGQDAIEFLTSFNKNGDMLPMASTASGGELSRLTLGIKSMMAEKMEMPTIIFDEIDTGVSGEIAAKMANMMAAMSAEMQVIAITHLPQVASKGDRHYKVSKRDTEDRTVSTVVELTSEERVREIAGMLSGEEISEEALKAAKTLIKPSNNIVQTNK